MAVKKIELSVCEDCTKPIGEDEREIILEGGMTSRPPKNEHPGMKATGPGAPAGAYHPFCLAKRMNLSNVASRGG
jgi:hypothetical protein